MWRQAGAQRHLEALLVGLDEIERIAGSAFDHLAVGHHFGDGVRAEAARAQKRARRQADEAVAAKALAADHRFEQEAVRTAALAVGQFEVQRQGSFKVREGFCHQRNAVVAFAREAMEFEFSDQGSVLPGRQAGQQAGAPSSSGKAARATRRVPDSNRHTLGAVGTPGPGSPVCATCDERAVNEHGAKCSKCAPGPPPVQ